MRFAERVGLSQLAHAPLAHVQNILGYLTVGIYIRNPCNFLIEDGAVLE
jgi:hypothetical protein